jgi:hypothetical protein
MTHEASRLLEKYEKEKLNSFWRLEQLNYDIGDFCKRTRQRAKISLRALAKAMDISAMYLSDLENGKRHWNKVLLDKWIYSLKP